MKKGKITISDLYCMQCGFHTTIPRTCTRKRSFGHLKQEWCTACKMKVNFREVRETDFSLEYVIERMCV